MQLKRYFNEKEIKVIRKYMAIQQKLYRKKKKKEGE